jgi:hypothetical protein
MKCIWIRTVVDDQGKVVFQETTEGKYTISEYSVDLDRLRVIYHAIGSLFADLNAPLGMPHSKEEI